jgi:hypothetical protein
LFPSAASGHDRLMKPDWEYNPRWIVEERVNEIANVFPVFLFTLQSHAPLKWILSPPHLFPYFRLQIPVNETMRKLRTVGGESWAVWMDLQPAWEKVSSKFRDLRANRRPATGQALLSETMKSESTDRCFELFKNRWDWQIH